jgi:DNA-binding transcriptional LysR family regulator
MSLPLNYLAGKAIQPLPRLPDCNPVTLINDAFLAHGFGPNIVQEAPDTHTILSLVGAGAGIGFVPITADHIKLPGVVLIPVTDIPDIPLAMAWREHDGNPALHALIDLIDDVSADSGDTDRCDQV